MQKTTEAYKSWLLKHMPESFQKEVPQNELEILAHTLVYAENMDEDIHLKFGSSTSLVVCLHKEGTDEEILKHYGGTRIGIPQYHMYVSSAPLPSHGQPLHIARLNFVQLTEQADMIQMPENCAEQLFKDVQDKDSVQYRFFPSSCKSRGTLCFAWKNVQRRYFLCRLVAMFRRHGLRAVNMRFSYIKPLSVQCVLLGMVELEGAETIADEMKMHHMFMEFELLKNFRGDDLLEDVVERGIISGNQANLLRAYTSLVGQILADVDAAMYTEDAIVEAMTSQIMLTVDVLKAFACKFCPCKRNDAEYARIMSDVRARIAAMDTGMKKNDDRRRMIFGQLVSVVDHTMRCNVYDLHKLGLVFRLDPAYMDCVPGFDRKKKYPDLPYGIYYAKGWNYIAFQIRFRDLARGGMRTVVPWNHEHELYERINMFTECYGLAYTQQKKNKDIPEGGSKSILFLSANEELEHERMLAEKEMRLSGMSEEAVKEASAQFTKEQQFEYMYYNQRCFLNSFLKLIVWDFEKNKLQYIDRTVDHMGYPEFIYLGPDENFHDALIQWLAAESTRLGYYPGGAFISGKQEVGVNHKEYGVTTWGCLQFLHEALKYANINGRFTCKITGGPDGDVAGNFMLMLQKYYAQRAVITVVTDGSGSAYDPEGFDQDALVSMFHKVQMMQDFPREKLHKGAWVLAVHKTRQPTPLLKECLLIKCVEDGKVVEEWIPSSQANKMWSTTAHVVPADVFLPCGGRPRALNMGNIEQYFTDGRPNGIVVVEGANLYITPDAREYLEDRGVIVMRDSSANKCGVVSSSYEILGGLSLTDDMFKKVKKELASNIIDRLEKIALAEARCMIEYHRKHEKKIRMTAISEMVSAKINKFTDAIAEYLKPMDLNAPENKQLLDIFINYVPQCITRDHLDRCLKRVPEMHKKAIIATKIACELTYNKGLDWEPTIATALPVILPTIH